MGRRNRIPGDNSQPLKLRLFRLPFVDGDYDRWGAYWGFPANVWIAQSVDVVAFGDSLQPVELFVRANSREQARAEVRKVLPQARFYR